MEGDLYPTATTEPAETKPAVLAEVGQQLGDLLARMTAVEALLTRLVEQRAVKDWYTTEEVAGILGKAEFTVREWCRLRRIHAQKQGSGRGRHQAWVVA